MSVKDIDRGWEKAVKEMEFWSTHEVVMGWMEGEKERDSDSESLSNATLAATHEYGTTDGRIPEGRLGLREWVDRSQGEIGEKMGRAFSNAIPNGNAKREMNKVGLWSVSAWRKYQRDVQPGPEWSIATEKAKVKKLGQAGYFREKKLNVTGQLINGNVHQVRKKKT